MACPNKNTPEWRVLEDALGVFGAYKVFIANGYEIPSMTQVTEFLDAINPIYDLEYNQLSPSDVQIYQDQLEGLFKVKSVRITASPAKITVAQ